MRSTGETEIETEIEADAKLKSRSRLRSNLQTEVEVKACNETHCDLVVVDVKKATSFDETYDVKKATTSWGNI